MRWSGIRLLVLLVYLSAPSLAWADFLAASRPKALGNAAQTKRYTDENTRRKCLSEWVNLFRKGSK